MNLQTCNFKNIKISKALSESNLKISEQNKKEHLEEIIKNDPLFDIINQHKKRLQEIKEWKTNFTNGNNDSQSETNFNDVNKVLDQNVINDNIKKNIKSAKDFLKLNCINNTQILEDNNIDKNIGDNLVNGINYNIIDNNNINYTSKLNENKENIPQNENNKNDFFYSIKKDIENNKIINKRNPNKNYMKTGSNFIKKLEIENTPNSNNYDLNNTDYYRNNKYLTNRLDNNYSSKNIINDNIKLLEFKLEKKKIKIKNLESNIDLLTKENQNLKKYINELEEKIGNFHLNNQTNILKQDNIINREQEMLNKINSLTEELTIKNNQIEKMKNLDKLKIQDIQILSQKCRDLELISNENNKEKMTKIDKLINDNNNLKSNIRNTEKIMFTINYFIKKIYNMIPSLSIYEYFEDVKEPSELQRHLINIENFINEYIIYDSNKKSKFMIDFYKNKNNENIIDNDEEGEKENYEEKINRHNINLLHEVKDKKKLKKKKSFNSSRGKRELSSKKNLKIHKK